MSEDTYLSPIELHDRKVELYMLIAKDFVLDYFKQNLPDSALKYFDFDKEDKKFKEYIQKLMKSFGFKVVSILWIIIIL